MAFPLLIAANKAALLPASSLGDLAVGTSDGGWIAGRGGGGRALAADLGAAVPGSAPWL